MKSERHVCCFSSPLEGLAANCGGLAGELKSAGELDLRIGSKPLILRSSPVRHPHRRIAADR